MRRFCFFITVFAVCSAQAQADTIVRSVYQANFMGLPVSRAFVTMTLADKTYRIEGSGRSSPIASVLVPMRAKFSARGRFATNAVQPESFDAHVTAGKDQYDITLQLKKGSVAKESARPQLSPVPDLVKVTEEMKRDVIDPLSAFLVPYQAGPEKVCARTLPIYTGRERFDLKLSFSRNEQINIPGLYQGEAQVCSVRYLPKGGHRAQKKEIRYMIDNKAMEVWLVPLPQQSLMGLARVEIGTKLGPVRVRLERAELGPMPGQKT